MILDLAIMLSPTSVIMTRLLFHINNLDAQRLSQQIFNLHAERGLTNKSPLRGFNETL
jgi:hypothetical protein